ncbi:tetratricopeptide repeat protein [Nocardia sp. NPDC023852]|uniref:tetratricopeptide repeat protein n=1 Tax=Nocardia sp. NPDC023852 TaxID=3154697 RepID=UPI0033E84668
MTGALNKWQDHPLVSRAAALACDVASFPSWGFESLWRALVRAAYHTWRRDLDRAARIDLLSLRARDENDDGSGPLAAELLGTAIALREEWEVDGPTEGLPAIADLLWQLLRALEEYGAAGPTDHARVMTQGAHAGRRLVAIYSEMVETDRAAHLSSLAEAITTSAGFITGVDGPLAGADQSERGVLLFEELADSFTSRGFRRLSRAWSEHIALLDRAGFASRAREWEQHRTEKLRILATARSTVGAGAIALHGLRSLARLLNSHDLHAETASLSAHIVTLAEAAAVDHATVTNLADILRQHGVYLHRAGQRAEAVATWHRCVEVQRRLIGTSADIDGTVVADTYHTIVEQAEKIGDRSAAIEFGGRAIDELSRSAELDRVTHLPRLVDKLRAQARRLDNAGRRDEAVEVAEEAVARAQDLLTLDPEQYRPNLSWALTCAASIHFGSRRAEAADLRSRQALDLIEDLARTGGYTAALANALHNRALALNLRDDYALSMESSARAATLYEELAAGKDDRRASWANVLCTRAISAEKLRDFDTALDCVTRAEQIYSRLAERNPARYSADLAYALNRLASIHQSMGTGQIAALAARALEICASLPEGQERDDLQASALNALIRNLTGTGQPREALTHSTVLLEVQERMVARDPAETIELVIALGNHTLCLSQLGREHEALEYASRAVDLVRPLAESEPGPNLATMASALGRYATQLAETGRADRAVEVSAEAVACYEQLLTDHRDLHLRSAATCLDNYALWLDRADRTEEGFAASARSLAMFEELLERGGDRAHLGSCLLNHANRLQRHERYTEALGYATRALELYEELAPENPGAHVPSLARALHLQSTALDGLGRHDEALPPQQRAVRICAARAAHDRQLNLTFLAKTTCGLGRRLAHAGQWPRARDQLRTGVWLWEHLTEFDTRLHLDGLAAALGNSARFFRDHDEWADAAAYFERAATAYEELITRDPRAHLADLG